MSLEEKLRSAKTIGQALLLMQPDAEEWIPSSSMGPDEYLDISVFEGAVNKKFQAAIFGNGGLSNNWKSLLKAVDIFKKDKTNTTAPSQLSSKELDAIYTGRMESKEISIRYLKTGIEILKRVAGESMGGKTTENYFGAKPPALDDATTLEMALLLFQPDAEEGLPQETFFQDAKPDFSMFKGDARKRFETMISDNEAPQAEWVNVLAAVDRGETTDSVQLGRELLAQVALDQRPWIPAVETKKVTEKKVLGGTSDADLPRIAPLWFHHFAQKFDLPKVLGKDLYEYVLNGGFETDDKVSYEELAAIAEVDGYSKSFFTRLAYSLGDKEKETFRQAFRSFQSHAFFATYHMKVRGHQYEVECYMDPLSPFVEIRILEGAEPTELENLILWNLRRAVSAEKRGKELREAFDAVVKI